jgi:hypothetical protein
MYRNVVILVPAKRTEGCESTHFDITLPYQETEQNGGGSRSGTSLRNCTVGSRILAVSVIAVVLLW